MKRSNIFLALIMLMTVTLTSCEDRDYPAGLAEYENYYYAGFLPWNNTGTESVFRTQTTLVKFEVQFQSAFIRDYDAVAQYTLVSPATGAAVLGQDFQVVDKDGNTIQPVGGKYNLTFPKAEKKSDFIYFKVLNSAIAGTRKIEINLVKNEQPAYIVGTFSQSFKRFLEIK